MRIRRPSHRKHGQAGFTLIELMIAGVLLVFGIMTMAGLVGLAVKNNGHSRLDSTATMLNQAVVEQLINGINNKELNTAGTGSTDCSVTGTACINDCNDTGTAWPIDSDGPGAPLCTSSTSTADNCQPGNIDCVKPQVSGYSMNYAVCMGNTRRAVYDVRWNISAPDGTSHTSILTVGSRLQTAGTQTQGNVGIINFPINMKVMVGPDPIETP